jgi:hypothetical protein
MADPRLNSIHLDFPRRDDFRHARAALLGSRGSSTVALERGLEQWVQAGGQTMIQDAKECVPPEVSFWLTDQQSIYPLKVGINTIGRLPDNDVVVQAPYVSRRHCAVVVHLHNGCELHDIASKNGTFVNGQKITGPTRLRHGDEIKMCDLRLTFLSRLGEERGDGPEFAPTQG